MRSRECLKHCRFRRHRPSRTADSPGRCSRKVSKRWPASTSRRFRDPFASPRQRRRRTPRRAIRPRRPNCAKFENGSRRRKKPPANTLPPSRRLKPRSRRRRRQSQKLALIGSGQKRNSMKPNERWPNFAVGTVADQNRLIRNQPFKLRSRRNPNMVQCVRSGMIRHLAMFAPKAAFLIGLLLAPSIVAAQDRPDFRITRTDQPPKIDGELDDAAWQGGALPLGDWLSYNPLRGQSGSPDTQVFVAYDERNIYFAFHCFDSEPDKIRTTLTRRDTAFNDDWIAVSLDSAATGQTAYHLFVNPSGIQMDALQTSA